MKDSEYKNIARLTMERVGHYNITPLQFYETWKELNPDSTLQKLTIMERYIKWKHKIES